MTIELAYGGARIPVEIPEGVTVDRFSSDSDRRPVSFDEFTSLWDATAGARFRTGSPLVVVNDGYRHTPTARLLEWIDRRDSTLLDRARFLIATGAHAAPSEEHLQTIFGKALDRVRSRVIVHLATDQSSLRPVGTDQFDQPAYIHRLVMEAESILVIGSVEPHYFAGYTGGRKSFFPGLCDLATIERNHNLASSLECRPLRLRGNPVAEHLDTLTAGLDLKDIISIQAVLGADGELRGLFVGGLGESFTAAVARAREMFSHPISEPYDIVLAELLPPLDANLYQCQKALENCQTAAVDGGAVVVLSACKDGVGSPYFIDQARDWDRDTNRPKTGGPRFGSHKLSRVNAIGRRVSVFLHSGLPDDTPRTVFFEPLHDINDLLAQAATEHATLRVAVVHDAGHTVLTGP